MKRNTKTILVLLLSIYSFNLTSQETYPGHEIIGKGYDIFGEYANNKSVSDYSIFDLSKMKNVTNSLSQKTPKYVRVKNISNHLIKTVEGSSKKEYITNLSKEMGLSGEAFFFKASINHQFNQNTSTTTNYFYYTYMDINTKWKVSLDIRNIDTLINYLDIQFKSDLENLEPEELFDLYGTHFISNAYLGGRIDYSTSTEILNTTSNTDVKTAINAQYMAIQGNIEIDDKSKNTLSEIETTTKLSIVGGNSEFTNNIHNYDQYLKWADGIKNTPVLSGFDKKSLRPIWLLTCNESRKKELLNYFNNVILSNHPLPSFFRSDDILDNVKVTKEFDVNVIGFNIIKDCDVGTYLTGDENGEFKYRIKIYSNGVLIKTLETEAGYINNVWSGNYLNINETIRIQVPLSSEANIKVYWKLTEIDEFSNNERVGEDSQIHKSPFAINDLYNIKDENNTMYWKSKLYHSSECRADLYYQISPIQNKTANEFGNKGWAEFENRNYTKCLEYSKEALKVDNSLAYVHYNVALVYLINNNPRAFDKYKFTTSICSKKSTINSALKDILDYESTNGKLSNSEPIKLWLKTKM